MEHGRADAGPAQFEVVLPAPSPLVGTCLAAHPINLFSTFLSFRGRKLTSIIMSCAGTKHRGGGGPRSSAPYFLPSCTSSSRPFAPGVHTEGGWAHLLSRSSPKGLFGLHGLILTACCCWENVRDKVPSSVDGRRLWGSLSALAGQALARCMLSRHQATRPRPAVEQADNADQCSAGLRMVSSCRASRMIKLRVTCECHASERFRSSR